MAGRWLINIAAGLALLGLMTWGVFLWMNWYTNHGEEVVVPNLKGITYEQAAEKLDEANLRYVLFDSIYNADLKRNSIADQDPLPGSMVKPKRLVYLTVNSLDKPKVKMPRLVDQSFNLSKMLLKKAGLELGEVYYKYDEIGHNLVLEQKLNSRNVPEGKLLDKGTSIDLVVATNRKTIVSDTSGESLVSLKELQKRWEVQKQQWEEKANKGKPKEGKTKTKE